MNERGVCLALINWYSVVQRVENGTLSRGEVIPSVCTASIKKFVQAGLDGLPLDRINPFRLISIFPTSQEVIEWRWDLKQLVRHEHPWRLHQWVSSGFDEPKAQKVRGRTFKQAQSHKSAGSIAWLRSLHRSHSPQTGPFSICMHREDAVTVSYTAVSVFGSRARMEHVRGALCNSSEVSHHSLHVARA
ncbi:MAG TPA: hypothetical protein VL793_12820 [Patescibacteria group bacterium]|nr:hypothetical protein [Patescibacteria group bacterium]